MSRPQERKTQNDTDPDGTLQVARGMSEKEARRQHHENVLKKNKSKLDRVRVEKYLGGPNAHHQEQRRKALQKDDLDMKMDRLTPSQARALTKRRGKVDKVTRAKLNRQDAKRMEAAMAAADAQVVLHTETPGLVQSEHDMERTTALTQLQLKRNHLNEQTARQIFDLKLPQYAPYGVEYDRSGRCAVLYGQGGHVAVMDCHLQKLETEFHVSERIRDATFLHNTTLFATAQSNHVFIYDSDGVEIHRLEEHNDPFRLQFLPHHWLLASVGRAGWLKYHDTSTGDLVSQHRTKLGSCRVMKQNPSNAVMHLGHHNGTVTLWSPSSSEYLVKILCHKGSPVLSMAIDQSGHYMVTGGADRQVKVWDLRMFKETHAYYTSAGVPATMDISQRGVLGIGHSIHATFWSPEALRTKVKAPYMHHEVPGCGPLETLRFRPFEDVCGIGHGAGMSSIVIPGSGEPNLDTMEYNTNPFQDKQQRREAEVRSLLDKLNPNMISLDPDVVGGIEESDPHTRLERVRDLQDEANAKVLLVKKQKTKKRGRSKIQTKLRRKHKNVVDASTLKLREAREQEKAEKEMERKKRDGGGEAETPKDTAPAALKRFFSDR